MRPARAAARRTMLRDEIRTGLTARIMDGTHAPGERLVEMRIAKEFGVSQSPVPEAIRDLASLRLITHEPYRATRVRALSMSELRAVVPVREALGIVARRLGMARLMADLGLLGDRLDAMRAAAAADDRHAFAVNDAALHATLVDAAENPRAARCLGGRRGRPPRVRDRQPPRPRPETHPPIIAACERGDAEQAAVELGIHLWRYGLDPPEGSGGKS